MQARLFLKIMKIFIYIVLLILPLQFSMASTPDLEAQRKNFVLAEKMIRKGKDAQFFKQLSKLENYPLNPYLQYHWLKKNLNQTKKIKTFLHGYKDTRYAGLLNYKWQLYLAKNKQWTEFLKHYRPGKNTKLQCYYYRAKYNAGAKKEALLAAQKLWAVGKSQPGECDPLFKTLKGSPYFTSDLLWQRFDAALRNRKIPLANYVKRLMNKKNQKIAQVWLDIHSKPLRLKNKTLLNKNTPQAGNIFSHGVNRLISKDLSKAIAIWDARKADYKISSAAINRVEKRLAMSLAYRRDSRAFTRLSGLAEPDLSAQEWTIRSALRQQNWPNVKQAINKLNKEDRKKDKWRYWLARVNENTGKSKAANFTFDKLSKNRSYYGYLSAEKVDKDYQLVDNPIKVAPLMYKRLKNSEDFRVVAELIAVNKPLEAKRQWWYVISKLDKKEIVLAAKYAQEIDWKEVAIFTLAKAKYWDDVTVRFPMAYQAQVKKNAKTQKLNPAVILGLIRRESAFNKNAQSPVGARGLMQIMPKTGRQIAKELKQKWKSKTMLFNAETNVKFGSYYYKQLLNRFDGHYALAAAAYNAGPHRVKRWLPTSPLAADIWIETIPFKETRAYVSAVLTYALIYQKKLKKNVLTMKDFMRDVVPG